MTVKSLRKQLAAAIAMTLVATVALGSSTYAWFTMNREVSATDMNVRAKAEEGLLINEVAAFDSPTWDDVATAAQSADAPYLLYPASTANGSTWYHAASKKSNTAAAATQGTESSDLIVAAGAATGYETLSGLVAIEGMTDTAVGNSKAARTTYGRDANAEAGFYVKYTYYLKSSSGSITLGTNPLDMNIAIKSVTATAATTNSTALNASLRVGIKLNSVFYIYAPVTGYTDTYYVNAGDTATTPIDGATKTNTDLGTLPAVGENGTAVDVYLWYEGEDANCKSDNATATTLDSIDVDIVFALEQIPTN